MSKLWVLILAAIAAFAQDKAAKIGEVMSLYHDYGQFNGAVLVAEAGKVIYKKGFGLANMEWNIPNQPDTKFRLGSITKQFTAALILQLVEEGKIALDDKMSKYLDDYPKKTADRVTIHQLLNHTSGIPSYTSLPNFFRDKSRDPYKPMELAEIFWEMDLEFEPGSKFRYNNSGYHLLGVVIEKATGKPYAEALEERILRPLNMRDSGYDLNQPLLPRRAGAYSRTLDGYENAAYLDMTIPYAAGSLYSTVEDLYVWDQALYTDRILSEKSRNLMLTPGQSNYGYGWIIRNISVPGAERKVTVVGHGGGINGFNTLIERITEDRRLVVLLNNTGGTRLPEMSQTIRNILYDAPVTPPKKPAGQALYRTLIDSGVQAAVKQCRQWKADAASGYDVDAGELGMVTRRLISLKRIGDAEEIARLNVEFHPKQSLPHYSLGEVYREAGKREEAIKSYARALELNPEDRGPLAQRLKEMLTQ